VCGNIVCAYIRHVHIRTSESGAEVESLYLHAIVVSSSLT